MLTTINTTMKAIRVHRSGGPEVLDYEEVPRPIAGPGEVLIRVYAAGVNPGDWRGRAGFPDLPEHLRPIIKRPSTPGFDASGIVEAVGPGVTEFQEGDAVYGMIRFPLKGSTYAEYTTAPVTDLAPKPATIDHLQAAAVPMAALTAWQQLFDHAHLEAGRTVLVNGAAGGVGHFAVQLAKAKGAHVIGVASGRHVAFLQELGIDQFIDYMTTPVEQAVSNVDLVLDTVGGENPVRLLPVLKHGGMLIPVNLGHPAASQAEAFGVTIGGKQVHANAGQLVEIGRLIDTGQVRVAIDTVVPLSEAYKAHVRGEAGHMRGKIVLRVGE